MRLPKQTPLDKLFDLGKDFKNGDRLVEPEKGYWPDDVFQVDDI